MKKLFGGGGSKGPAPPPSTTQFTDTRTPTTVDRTKASNAPRRELVRLVLHETMRKHGIPSDWMDCRALSVLTKKHKAGMHVQFLVFKGDHELLNWVHAFQESFWANIMRTDPAAGEWLFSVGWEFYGKSVQGFDVMPDPTSWGKIGPETEPMPPENLGRPADAGDTLPPEEEDTQPPEEAADTLPPELAYEQDSALADDLQALQAAMSMPGELVDLPEPPPGKQPPAA
ncbi:MAG TPA: hypothetical protein VIE63_03755 [Ramlibacter sp.]